MNKILEDLGFGVITGEDMSLVFIDPEGQEFGRISPRLSAILEELYLLEATKYIRTRYLERYYIIQENPNLFYEGTPETRYIDIFSGEVVTKGRALIPILDELSKIILYEKLGLIFLEVEDEEGNLGLVCLDRMGYEIYREIPVTSGWKQNLYEKKFQDREITSRGSNNL